MDSYEVMKEVVDNVGAKQVASALNVSTSLVYKWCEKPKQDEDDTASGARNPLDRLYELSKCAGGGELAAWLCEQEGGFFVSNPTIDAGSVDGEFVTNTQRMIKEFADVLRVMSDSMAKNGRIDPQESKRIRKEWEDVKRAAERLVRACELGVFGEQ